MKTAKRILWITAFVSLVGTAAVLPLMPERVPMHYNAAWEIDRWGSKYENLLLPLMTVGMALFFAALASYYERKSKENAEDKESVQAASNAKVMWIVGAAVTVFFTAMQGMILYAAYHGAASDGSAQAENISRVTFVLTGALYIVLGNYMPKTRRNSTVGMRVSWSMYNDNTWRKCNRFGGIVMMLTVSVLGVSYDQVASSADMTTVEEVGFDGLIPVYAEDIENGTYDVNVESSSSMFRIQSAQLTVTDSEMTVALALGSTSYLKLFAGTAEQAAASTEDQYISYTENGDGVVFQVPVEALDQPFSCAAFSSKKEMWYDRSLLVRADSLPADALHVAIADYEQLKKDARDRQIEAQKSQSQLEDLAAETEMEDGEYEVPVSLEGGSGKATIASPATLIVKDGRAFARIQWSSSHYDYMLVEGMKILPEEKVSPEDNSVFVIPVTSLSEPMQVIGDTTAMSTPHEVEYTLKFEMPDEGSGHSTVWIVIGVVVILCALLIWLLKRKK